MILLVLSLAHAQEADVAGQKLTFDERVVRGEVAAGSVYLFQREPRALPGLVPVRRSYRAEIIEPLIPERAKRDAKRR